MLYLQENQTLFGSNTNRDYLMSGIQGPEQSELIKNCTLEVYYSRWLAWHAVFICIHYDLIGTPACNQRSSKYKLAILFF